MTKKLIILNSCLCFDAIRSNVTAQFKSVFEKNWFVLNIRVSWVLVICATALISSDLLDCMYI